MLNMKRALLIVFIVLLGTGMIFYPYVAIYFSDQNASKAVQVYSKSVDEIDEKTLNAEWKRAQEYNEQLSGGTIQDPFIPGSGMVLDENYKGILNVNGTMGHVYIPKINVNLSIYHGTSEATLQKGVGHLEGTALPVGGSGTHTILTGHRGLTHARMFTDLIELKEGDTFYLYILNETLAYQVDQIKVVEPSDTSALKPAKDEDYATLITCTPYGVNSHRLLVRGTRIEYIPQAEKKAAMEETIDGWTSEERTLFIAAAVTTALMLVLILLALILRRRKDKQEVPDTEPKHTMPESRHLAAKPRKRKQHGKKSKERKVRWWDET